MASTARAGDPPATDDVAIAPRHKETRGVPGSVLLWCRGATAIQDGAGGGAAAASTDDFQSANAPLEDRFSVTKVLLTEEAAEQEALRLSALSSDKDCRYVVHITRLDER